MASFLPATLENSLAGAMALVRAAPVQAAAVAAGAVCGVGLFVVVMLLVFSRRANGRRVSTDPVSPWQASATDVVFIPPYPTGIVSYPSSAPVAAHVCSPARAPLEALASGELCAIDSGVPESMSPPPQSDIETGPMSAVTIAAVVDGERRPLTTSKSSSNLMRAVSVADLDLDDAPTQLAEPCFGGHAGIDDSWASMAHPELPPVPPSARQLSPS